MTALSKLVRTSAVRWSVIYLLVFALTSGSVLGYLFWRTNNLLTDQVLETIAAEIKGLREQFRVGGGRLLATTVSDRSARPGNSIYYLRGAGAEKIAGNLSRVPPELIANSKGGLFRYERRSADGREKRLAVGIPIQVPGGALLIVGRDIQDQRDLVVITRQMLVWGIILVSIVGIGGGLWVGRNFLRRIDTVAATSRAIMKGNLKQRIPLTGSGDELDRLSQSLNEMLDRIEQLMSGMKEVSDNIAHDLKTPLNRLRNRVEGALRDPRGSEVHKEALERTIEEADDLIRTFNSLLSIARLEAGALAGDAVVIDLYDTVRGIADLYEPVAEEAGMMLDVDAAKDMKILGEQQLISQALTNLIDNAMTHGGDRQGDQSHQDPPRVTVNLYRQGEQAVIEVGDNGPGVPADQRARVLDRFVRLEVSRTRPGSGLGLSLVAAVVRLHGGRISLESNEPGLKVRLEFPIVEGPSGNQPAERIL